MPRRPKDSLPTLPHHQTSGRARVTSNGRDPWLGKWGAFDARLARDRVIADYLVTRRVRDSETPPSEPTMVTIDLGVPGAAVTPAVGVAGDIEDRISSELTVAEVLSRYLEYCDCDYRTPGVSRLSLLSGLMDYRENFPRNRVIILRNCALRCPGGLIPSCVCSSSFRGTANMNR